MGSSSIILKQLLFLILLLSSLSLIGQIERIKCSDNEEENQWLKENYEFLEYWLQNENIELNNNSYFFVGGGEGEVSFVHSAFLLTKKHETIIYQYSTLSLLNEQIVDESITIEYLTKYFKKLNKGVDNNIIPNAEYTVLSDNKKGKVKCLKKFYTVLDLPLKKGDEGLLDFKQIVNDMKSNFK